MLKKYFAKLVKYMKNMHNIDRLFNMLEDARVNPKYKTGQALMPLLLGLLIRIESMNNVVNTAIRNKTFYHGTIDGFTVAAIDGTKFFGSNKKCCPECLSSKNHHYHSGVVYDALACNSQWINHCFDLGLDAVVRAKKNNNNSIKLVKKKVNKLSPVVVWDNNAEFERVSVFETTFLLDKVDRPLRFVRFEIKRMNGRYSQILIVTSRLDMKLETLFKMIRGRWDIENTIFNNLKTECGLEHCFVHGGNSVEAVLYLIFIAANIMQLFIFRRLKIFGRTQTEVVKLLLKGLYLLKYKKELVFSSA